MGLGRFHPAKLHAIANRKRKCPVIVMQRRGPDWLPYGKAQAVDNGLSQTNGLNAGPWMKIQQIARGIKNMQSCGHADRLISRLRCANGERIAQVLNNLVSNAIKYSPNGGDVLVSRSLFDVAQWPKV
jgi:hypothetical protein